MTKIRRTIRHYPEEGGKGFVVEDRMSENGDAPTGVYITQSASVKTEPYQTIELTTGEALGLIAALRELGYEVPA